jgi:hypothetical protein
MEFFQFTGEGLGVGGRELGFAEAAGRSGVSAERRKYVQKLQDGGFLPRAATVKPRWATEISFNGLTRRNCARTSAGEAITTLSPRDNVAQASRLPLEAFDGGAGKTPALLCGGDRIVVTTAMAPQRGPGSMGDLPRCCLSGCCNQSSRYGGHQPRNTQNDTKRQAETGFAVQTAGKRAIQSP